LPLKSTASCLNEIPLEMKNQKRGGSDFYLSLVNKSFSTSEALNKSGVLPSIKTPEEIGPPKFYTNLAAAVSIQ
jgi:hypothetical protein